MKQQQQVLRSSEVGGILSHLKSINPVISYKEALLSNTNEYAKKVIQKNHAVNINANEKQENKSPYKQVRDYLDKSPKTVRWEDLKNIKEALRYNAESRKGKKISKNKTIQLIKYLTKTRDRFRVEISKKDPGKEILNIIHENPFETLTVEEGKIVPRKFEKETILRREKNRNLDKNKVSERNISKEERVLKSVEILEIDSGKDKREVETKKVRGKMQDANMANEDTLILEKKRRRGQNEEDELRNSNESINDSNNTNLNGGNTHFMRTDQDSEYPDSHTTSPPYSPDKDKTHRQQQLMPKPQPRQNEREVENTRRITLEKERFANAKSRIEERLEKTKEERFVIHTNIRKYKNIRLSEDILEHLREETNAHIQKEERSGKHIRKRLRVCEKGPRGRGNGTQSSEGHPITTNEGRRNYEERSSDREDKYEGLEKPIQYEERSLLSRNGQQYHAITKRNENEKKKRRKKKKRKNENILDPNKADAVKELKKKSSASIRFIDYYSAGNEQGYWTVNLKNLHPKTEKEDLIKDLELITGDPPLGGYFCFEKMYAYVDFQNRATVLALVEMGTVQTRLAHINCQHPANDGTSKKNVVFAKGFPSNMEDEWLMEILNGMDIFPERLHILVTNRTQKKSNGAFLHFEAAEEAKKVVAKGSISFAYGEEVFNMTFTHYVETKREPVGRMGTNLDFTFRDREDRGNFRQGPMQPQLRYRQAPPQYQRGPPPPSYSRPYSEYQEAPRDYYYEPQRSRGPPPRRQEWEYANQGRGQGRPPWDDDYGRRSRDRYDEFSVDDSLDKYPQANRYDNSGSRNSSRNDDRRSDRDYEGGNTPHSEEGEHGNNDVNY